MLTDQDVHDQLAAYGQWVARRAGGDVVFGSSTPEHPTGADRSIVEVGLEDSRRAGRPTHGRPRRSRWLLAAAALLLVCAGVVAVTVVRQGSAPTSQPERGVDPPGALFVLPGAATGFGVTNGSLSHIDGGAAPVGNVLIVGTSTGSVSRHLLSVSAGPRPGDASTEWDEVELATGPALVGTEPSSTLVTQQRGTRWLTVQGRPAEAQAALDVFDHLTVTPDGVTSLDAAAGLDVLADVPWGSSTDSVDGTFFELVDAGTDSPVDITVETFGTLDPLLAAAVVADEVEAITVRGVPGWHLSRQDSDGEWNAVTWMAMPKRAVAVSGHVPFEDLGAVAAGLVITDEATWKTALPDYTED